MWKCGGSSAQSDPTLNCKGSIGEQSGGVGEREGLDVCGGGGGGGGGG